MVVRTSLRGIRENEAILDEIRGGAQVTVVELDLSSMTSVMRFVSEFGSLNLPLIILA
jgi:NAD(P)-dependent dehydrogenase (short-subunit alcohol dehydrogenase family)